MGDRFEETFPNLMRVMEQMGQDFVTAYRRNLENSDRKATGNLLSSLQPRIVINNLDIELWLDLEGYAKFIDEGTKTHHRVNKYGVFNDISYKSSGNLKDNIRKWIEVKGIQPRPDRNGKLPTTEQLAFLITRKIATEGIEGSEDITKAMEEVFGKYTDLIQQAVEQDLDAVSEDICNRIALTF